MANIDTTQSALPAGTILKGGNASYTLLKTLGQGSFGITYLAKNIVGEDEVEQLFCIKEFFMRDINGRENTSVTSSNREGMFDYYKRKFEQESDHLSRLRHKNIVMVVDAFRENSTSYYVMQYIDGQSLDSLIAAKGRLSTDETVGIIRQVGSALGCMHSKGMLHLDVKPANVMMADEKTAILIDFGLSKQYDQNGQPESSTTVGSGTPGYAPIEQANHREGKDFPVQMDVYALGATMLKMLTGQRPPEASDILNFGFPKKELLAVGVTSSVAMVVEKAMAPQQNKRYKTVNDFLKALDIATNEETDIKQDSTVVDRPAQDDEEKSGNGSLGMTVVKWFAGLCVLITVTSIPDSILCDNLGLHGGQGFMQTFFNFMLQEYAPYDWMVNVITGRCDSFGYLLGFILSVIGVSIAGFVMNKRWNRTFGETLWHDRIWIVAICLGINTIASLVVSRNQEFVIMWAFFLQASFCALGTLAFMKKKDI